MNWTPIEYEAVGAAVALAVGIFLGIVLRGRSARRQIERLSDELDSAQKRLVAAGATQPTEKAASGLRWTGTELAAVIAAFATLIGAIGSIYLSDQRREIAKQNEDLVGLRTELSSATSILKYNPAQWSLAEFPFPRTSPSVHWRIDSKDVNKVERRDCHSARLTLVYEGTGPALLHCGMGTLTVQIDQQSKVLFAREP